MTRPEEAGVVGRSRQFHCLVGLPTTGRGASSINSLAGPDTPLTHMWPIFNKLDRFDNLGRTGHTPNLQGGV